MASGCDETTLNPDARTRSKIKEKQPKFALSRYKAHKTESKILKSQKVARIG
jgi:hypothetical protein